ncbi:MAG: Rrf2 family transcriptional regulator [Oscillospiraceae bacterium]|jgi:Rrf2 family protein|nr:Rrf2 family transcriptional regulator [Oscillospiraceae bacterium]
MKISTKVQHALRMMLDFAEHRNEGFISLKEVAARLDVSKTYLEQVMIQINKTDFLITARGAQGGYKLARPTSKYTVGDIFRAVDGDIALAASAEQGSGDGDLRISRMAVDVWAGLERVMLDYLDNLTLQDIQDKHMSYLGYDFSI